MLQEVTTALDHFSEFHHVWMVDRDEDLENFNKENPKLSEYEAKIKHYEEMEIQINALPEYYDVGPIGMYTGKTLTFNDLFGENLTLKLN